MREHVERVLREAALWCGALAGLLALATAAAVLVLDADLVVFRSGSMAPAIDTGALALTVPTPARDLRAGDVVTVRSEDGGLVTHRVVSSTLRDDEATLVLQGDANRTPDPEAYVVTSAQRVVVDVPLAGYVVAHALTPPGLVAVAAACAALWLLTPAPRRPRRPPGPGGRHRAGGTVATAAVLVAASTGVHGTEAAFTDPALMPTGAFATAKLTAPTLTCTGGVATATFTWTAVPGATGYVLTVGGAAYPEQTTTSRTVLQVLSGGTATVVARRGPLSTTPFTATSNTVRYAAAVVVSCPV